MKKIMVLSLAVICTISFAACGLFTSESSSGAAGEAGTETTVSTGVKLSAEFTHEDPEGLEYETRYAYTSGESQEVKDGYKQNYGVDIIAEYFFLYADKDDHALCEYTYYVFKTPEDAAKFAEVLGEFGNTVETKGSVAYVYDDESMTSDIIQMQMQMCGMADDKASTYAQFMKEGYAYIEVQ